jgi:hypothetical protein
LSLTTGMHNTAVGYVSLKSITTGGYNTAIGSGALLANIADANTATGTFSLLANTTGGFNTAEGALALFRNTNGNSNTAIGAGTLLQNVSGSANTAVGNLALANNDITGNGSANSNTALGALALFNNIGGWENTAVGDGALQNNQTGYANVALGRQALFANVNGAYNTIVGFWAGHDINGTDNIYLGEFTGLGITSENNTTRVGSHQDHCYVDGIYQEQPDPNANQPVMVAPNGHLVTPVSSARFKENIKAMEQASEALLALQPVTFHYKNDTKAIPQFGLIAEDVAKVNPGLVILDGDGKPRSVRYDAVNAMLLNEFLKEHKRVGEQQATIEQLKANAAKQEATISGLNKNVEMLTTQLKEQAAQIQKVSAQMELSNAIGQTALNNP